MSQKQVEITAVTRDAEQNSLGTQSTFGWTEDDGATVTIGVGYLPDLENCLPGDITVSVNTVTARQAQGVTRTLDEENGVQVLSLTYE